MMKQMMMAAVLMVALSGAASADPVRSGAAPALSPAALRLVRVSTPRTARPVAARPAAREEFAGTHMLRFFQKSVDAVSECGNKGGLPGDAMRMAAY